GRRCSLNSPLKLRKIAPEYTRALGPEGRYNRRLLISERRGEAMRERLLAAEKVTGIRWQGGVLHLLDQRLLPSEERWLACDKVAQGEAATGDMGVRGASAIGIAAAYGLVLALEERLAEGGDWELDLEEDFLSLADARPTAANLFWALNRMRERLQRLRP